MTGEPLLLNVAPVTLPNMGEVKNVFVCMFFAVLFYLVFVHLFG
jgi:hypothetical protein